MERQRLPLEAGSATRRFHLFHDESGFTSKDRYGIHGMLAVPDELVDVLGASLLSVRMEHQYFSEIHFKRIGGARWPESSEWRVARDWIALLFGHFFTKVRFKAFAVDTHHADYDRSRYPTPLAAYRRFFVTDAKALVAWCLRGSGNLVITPYTDAGNSLAKRQRRRDGTLFDSFARYLERECELQREINRKDFYPTCLRVNPLREIESSPSKLSASAANELGLSEQQLQVRSDFVQLTDVVTASLAAALTLSPSNEGKQRLAELVVDGFSQWLDLPWHRVLKLRRRFSVSCFPGPGRTPYAVSLRGVRQLGIQYLRAHPEMAERLGPRFGLRPDATENQFTLEEILNAARARESHGKEDHIEASVPQISH